MRKLGASGIDLPSYCVDIVEENQSERPHSIRCEIGENIKFKTEGLEAYCISNWNSRVYDAFVVAAAVQFCDHIIHRPLSGWGRQIELSLPVHEPDLWGSTNVSSTLHDALNFLTGDQWIIQFKPRTTEADSPCQRRLSITNDTQAIIAYSEGLDSLAVSRIEELKYGRKLIRVRVGASSNFGATNNRDFPFALVPFKVNYGKRQSVESSSRSRGFKFALLSGVAAYLSHAQQIIVPESGQGALGPALIPVGQYYEDYRNHPLFTNYMESFLSAIFDYKTRYIHPRLWFTKSETLREFASSENFNSEELEQTRSCWQDQRYVSVSGKRRQCGICAACLLRRMSVHSAHLKERNEVYVWENLSATNFKDGVAHEANIPSQALREHAIAGILHLDHLANFLNSNTNHNRFDLHVLQLSQALGNLENNIRSNFVRLLQQHEKEWMGFLNSLGSNSFVSQWVMRSQ